MIGGGVVLGGVVVGVRVGETGSVAVGQKGRASVFEVLRGTSVLWWTLRTIFFIGFRFLYLIDWICLYSSRAHRRRPSQVLLFAQAAL